MLGFFYFHLYQIPPGEKLDGWDPTKMDQFEKLWGMKFHSCILSTYFFLPISESTILF
jgi:hypothetical protein